MLCRGGLSVVTGGERPVTWDTRRAQRERHRDSATATVPILRTAFANRGCPPADALRVTAARRHPEPAAWAEATHLGH